MPKQGANRRSYINIIMYTWSDILTLTNMTYYARIK